MTLGTISIHGWHGHPDAIPAALDLADNVYDAAATLDLSCDDDAGQTLPAALRWDDRHPTKAVAEVGTVLMAITLFIGATTAGWAVEQVIDGLWRKVSPALQRVLGTARRHPVRPDDEQHLVVQTVHTAERLVIEVWIPVELDQAETLTDRIVSLHGAARQQMAPPGTLIRYRLERDQTVRTETTRWQGEPT
jgi:hypothetical protein